MKELTSASFRDTFGELREPVQVRRYTTVLGTWFPVGTIQIASSTEVVMDDVKKAIEPDRVKESRGRLTKGLGEIPGQTEKRVDPQDTFGYSRPAPKPGKK